MLVTLLGCLSLCVGLLGFYRSFKHRSLIIFIWIIVLYYNVTSMFSIVEPSNTYIPDDLKVKYMLNYLLCTLAFYFSDRVFNKYTHNKISFNVIVKEKIFLLFEIIYWISIILTFIQLRSQDYSTYNTGAGAGWSQVIFMFTSGINFYFSIKKQWLKVIISALLIILIIASTNVRSLMYFLLMPVGFYFLYYMLFNVVSIKHFLWKSIPFALILLLVSFVLSYIRFGYYTIPETELTSIALHSMDNWSFGNQYINSLLKYFYGFTIPIRNAFNLIGISIQNSLSNIPSVPQLNAMISANVSDKSYLENAYHMPATLFYDFLVSWGHFAFIAAFIVYCYFVQIFNAFQKSALRIILFSSIVGWHFYMLMRGSVDTCSSAMAYPTLLGFVVYFIIKKLSLIKNESIKQKLYN